MSMMDPVFNLFTICLSMFNIARLDSLSCPIVDRKHVSVFVDKRTRLSTEHDVAGIAASISVALEKLAKWMTKN